MTALAACTIVSKNYISFARVVASSFLEHHPEGRFFVLLVDRNEGTLRPEEEDFTLVEAEELDNVPDLPSFLFKYTLLECNTAVKPYFLEHLYRRFELANLVYFDPDILITDSLAELAALVERYSIVLTPHLTDPIEDDCHPGELAVLQAGAYNLGFIALRFTPVTERLLRWWQQRLYDQCLVSVERGLFVDQKWVDLVPGIFKDVYVMTHPGYNVAYWNLHGRQVTRAGGGYLANGESLVFFHFSGIDPESLQGFSKHQDRFTLADIGEAAELCRHYRDLVLSAGYQEARSWPYAFARFDNGVAIPDLSRALYHSLEPARRRRFGNPFQSAGGDSFFAWLNQPADGAAKKSPYLSRLLAHLHASRPDLQEAYPDPARADFPIFSSWLTDFGRYELKLDEAFLKTLFRESRATLLTLDGLKRRLRNRLQRLYHSEAGKATRQSLKGLLGRDRTRALRKRLKPSPPPAGAAGPPSRRLPPPRRLERPGINLIGYLQAETGMGEAARGLARALQTTGVPVSLHSIDLNVLARNEDPTFAHQESTFPYDVNLFVVNADQVSAVYEHLGGEVFGGRYNVGYWLWELTTFPPTFHRAFDVLHEVWSPSSFCVDAISSVSPLPVRRVPLPMEPAAAKLDDRRHFDLPAETFLFFFMFNFLSYFERKNPLALIRAFKRAFSPDDDALLVLKTSQSDFAPEAAEAIRQEIASARVRLLDGYLSRDEISSLAALSDCYVSLHRCEGFGLTLAEAMFYGKPVIATPYSGNVDFFNLNNGLPVEYRLVELAEDAGPYPAGGVWAEPSVEDAARQMRRVFDEPRTARRIGERAREDVRRDLALEAVGRLLEQRFAQILAQVTRRAPRLPTPT